MAGYFLKGRRWYTNGSKNCMVFPGTQPEGYRLGVTANHSEQGREIRGRALTLANHKRWKEYHGNKSK